MKSQVLRRRNDGVRAFGEMTTQTVAARAELESAMTPNDHMEKLGTQPAEAM
jgi:hypothetical protein